MSTSGALLAPAPAQFATADPVDEEPRLRSALVKGTTRRRLTLHAVGLLLVLIAAAMVTGPGTGVTSDEGAGAYQAILLNRGSWDLPPTLPELDPAGARQPFYRADVGARIRAPYATHPLYPALLSLGSQVWPVGGLVATSVLGAWLAAVLAAVLAETIRPRRGPPALWLVGAMSPLAVDATWVLAHAPAAAAAAGMILAAERAARRRPLHTAGRVGWLGLSALGAALSVALRTEAAIVVVALVVGLLVCRRPDRRSLLAAFSVLVGGGGARIVEMAVRSHIVGTAIAVPGPPVSQDGFLPARWDAFRMSWIDPGMRGAALLVAAGLLTVAAMAHRRRFPDVVVGGLGTLGGILAVVWCATGPALVPGLLPATAWLGVGIIVVGRRLIDPGLPRLLAVTCGVAAIGILATQYAIGGGVEWGGRFYSILLPAAGALVAGTWPHGRRVQAVSLVLAVALVGGVTSIGGVLAVRAVHRKSDALERQLHVAAAVAPPQRPGDPDIRPVVVSRQALWPQLVWRSFDDLRWVTPKSPDVPCALVELHRAGFQRIVVADRPIEPLVRLAADLGWRQDPASPGAGLTRVLAAVGEPPVLPVGCPTVAVSSKAGLHPLPGPVATLGP